MNHTLDQRFKDSFALGDIQMAKYKHVSLLTLIRYLHCIEGTTLLKANIQHCRRIE
jgi:hypothetical protein